MPGVPRGSSAVSPPAAHVCMHACVVLRIMLILILISILRLRVIVITIIIITVVIVIVIVIVICVYICLVSAGGNSSIRVVIVWTSVYRVFVER